MKKFLMAIALGAAALSVSAKDLKEVTYTPEPRMTCENCEKKIKGNIRFEKGVKKIETNLEKQTITITYDADKTTEAKLEEAFSKLKYKVTKK
ncbi:MAG: cation transporter [Muribaculaceae bacterium]|nr:cation transporter [Muribaculaceae bacterium]